MTAPLTEVEREALWEAFHAWDHAAVEFEVICRRCVEFTADFGPLFADLIAAHVEPYRTALGRVLNEERIRHDHAYPMEIGQHHCAGCDLIEDLLVLVPTPPSGGEGL